MLNCVCVCVCVFSHVQLFATPWTAAHQAPPSMGFSSQEYWSGLPLPSLLHIWDYWYYSWKSWFQLVLHPAFLMMYSAYKLNKQSDNIQPWHTPFPIWNQSVVPCPLLTVAPWPAYRFLKRQASGMVFPSLSEFSTVYCDPHSQRLWHSQ